MPRKKRKYEAHITVGFRPDGSRIRKYIGSDRKDEFERLKKEAIRADHTPSALTIGEYAESWLGYKDSKSIQTREQYGYAIDKLKPIWNKSVSDVTALDLQRIINVNMDHARSCQVLKLALSQLYDHAIRDGIIRPVNIVKGLAVPQYTPKEKRIISDEEMERLLASDLSDRDRLYVEVMRNTGMRPSEALALRWDDFDLDGLSVTVRRSYAFDHGHPIEKLTKTNRIRQIPITSQFATTLHQMPKDGVLLFRCVNGKPMTKNAYRRMSERILTRLNVDGATLYSFRHTFASHLYYRAVMPGIISAMQAAAIMGHSVTVYLRTYTHVLDDQEQLDALRDALGRQKGDTGRQKTPHFRPFKPSRRRLAKPR